MDYYLSHMRSSYLQNTDTFHPNAKEYVSKMLRTNVCYTKKVLFTFEIMLRSTICVTTQVQFTFEINTDTFRTNVKNMHHRC